MASTRDTLRRALEQVPDFDGEPALAHDAMVVLAGRVIDMAEEEGRALTIWEKANVAQAIGSLAVGWLAMAYTALELAVEAAEKVSPRPVSPSDERSLATISVEQMRHALAVIASGPAVQQRARQ